MLTDDFEKLYARMTPTQLKDGLKWIVDNVGGIDPHTIVEIGVSYGGTLRFWEHLVNSGDVVIGVDISPNLSAVSSYFDDAEIVELEDGVWKVSSDRDVKIVRGDSMSPETVETVRRLLNGRSVDFLFVDGWHDYQHIKSDFDSYKQFVRSGGIVAFDDIEDGGSFYNNDLSGRKERMSTRNAIWWKP